MLLAHPAAEAVMDAGGLCEVLTQVRTPGQSLLSGIRQVRAGRLVRGSA